MKTITPKPRVCWVAPFGDDPDFKVILTSWPTKWQRFWFRVFFNWKFKGMNDD
jgi:hypothetical protein